MSADITGWRDVTLKVRKIVDGSNENDEKNHEQIPLKSNEMIFTRMIDGELYKYVDSPFGGLPGVRVTQKSERESILQRFRVLRPPVYERVKQS